MNKIQINKGLRTIRTYSVALWHKLQKVAVFCNEQLVRFVPHLNALVDRLVYLTGNDNEKQEAFLEKPHKLIGYYKDGFRFGDLAIDQDISFRHAAIFGKTGSGKGVFFFECNYLVDRNASIVIRDVPGDATKAAGFWESVGYNVVVINLTDALNKSTHMLNVIDGELTKADIGRIAEIIVSSIYKDKDFWVISATEACVIFLTILKTCLDEKYHNLHNLKYLIISFMADRNSLNNYVVQGSDELYTAFAALCNTPEKSLMSTISTLKSCFNNLDESTSLLTSRSTFSWQELRTHKTVVVLQSSVMDDSYHTLVQNLMYASLLRTMMVEIPSPSDLSVNVFLDEVTSLGAIGKMLETCFLNLRKYRCALAIGAQSKASLTGAFGKEIAESVVANCYSRLYLPGMDLDTAKYLEEYIGVHEIKKDKTVKKEESIMNAFSLRTMENKGVLLLADQPASIIPLKAYYKNYRMKKRLKLPMPKLLYLTDTLDTTEVPTIPLDVQTDNDSDVTKNN